jgi:hypothetical protein
VHINLFPAEACFTIGSSFQDPPVPRPPKRFERFELFERLERTCFIDTARRCSRTYLVLEKKGIHIRGVGIFRGRHSTCKIIETFFESLKRRIEFHLNEAFKQLVKQACETFPTIILYHFRAETNQLVKIGL